MPGDPNNRTVSDGSGGQHHHEGAIPSPGQAHRLGIGRKKEMVPWLTAPSAEGKEGGEGVGK